MVSSPGFFFICYTNADTNHFLSSKKSIMLSQNRIRAFLPTTNPAKAKTFYQDKLGLTLTSQDEFALEFDVNGTRLRITTVQELTPHPFTVFGWEVDNIATSIQMLEKKGITFERYNGLKQDDFGIWRAPSGAKIAWFKDPDGNVLSLIG